MIAKGLRDVLKTADSVRDLVGDRIYPRRLPQPARLPAIAISTISAGGNPTLDGRNVTRTVRMQVSCWATTADELDALVKAVRHKLDGWSGELDQDKGQAVLFDNELPLDEPDLDLPGIGVDFLVTTQEPS